jgi:hypothetical protein
MQASDPVRLTVQLTLGEIFRACYVVLAGAKDAWRWGISAIKNILYASGLFFVLCAVLCRSGETYTELALRSVIWGVLFFVIFMPLLLIILPPIILGVMAARGMLPRKPLLYLFFSDRIECRTDTSSSTFQWQAFQMIRETKGQFLLYYQKYMALVLPKRCFATQSEIEALRQLIRTQFSGRTVLRS